jgi:uncharacterized membrane protein (DUF2068 family)
MLPAMADDVRPRNQPPGTVKAERFVPQFHWELIACGLRGHALVGHDAREIRPSDRLVVREMDGIRWHRCLRCDSWLPLPPPEVPARDHPPDRDEIVLPLRGKPLRDTIVLRLIAINRLLHFIILGLLSAAILLFSANRSNLKDTFYKVISDIEGGPVGTGKHHGIVHELDRLFSLSAGTLHVVGAAIAVYAIVEGIEAVGLWLLKRWAEYLTLLVTASFLPLEVYEIAHKLSPLKIGAFIINVAVVAYLLFAKRLFGIRGGAEADEALRERDVGWDALERTAPEAGGLAPTRP